MPTTRGSILAGPSGTSSLSLITRPSGEAAEKGPAARRRPRPAREAYAPYAERAAEGAKKQRGLYRRPPLAPAGDGEGVSGDVGGLVGGQEQDRGGDFLRTAETPQRGHAIGAVLHRLGEPPQPVCRPLRVDGAGP